MFFSATPLSGALRFAQRRRKDDTEFNEPGTPKLPASAGACRPGARVQVWKTVSKQAKPDNCGICHLDQPFIHRAVVSNAEPDELTSLSFLLSLVIRLSRLRCLWAGCIALELRSWSASLGRSVPSFACHRDHWQPGISPHANDVPVVGSNTLRERLQTLEYANVEQERSGHIPRTLPVWRTRWEGESSKYRPALTSSLPFKIRPCSCDSGRRVAVL